MAITKVEYYNGITLLGSRTTAPFDQFTLVNAPEGNYSLRAKLYVDGVYAAISNAINVVVNPPEEWVTLIVEDYEERVNVDYGIVEDAVELKYDLNSMTEAQFNSALAIYNPNGGYKSGKIYDITPNDKDFTVTGGGGTRINKNSIFENVVLNQPKIDYSSGEAAFLFEPTRTNILRNSETLATQTVSVTGQPHTLSFYGTGSITMSGRYAGTLTGTGANDRVSLTFPLTEGTLYLTVSGSVKFAQLEAGSSSTTPIITTDSAVTRTALYGHCKYGGAYSIDNNWAYAELELLDLSATIIQQPFGMDGDPTLGTVRASYSVQWDGTQWLAYMRPSNTTWDTVNTGITTPRIKVAMCPKNGIIINGTVFTPPSTTIQNNGFSEVTIGNVRQSDKWLDAQSHVRFFDIRLLSEDKTEAEMIALTTI